MADDVIRLEVDAEGIALVTLDRPAARNALNGALRGRLWETMAAVDADDAVRVVILTGADPAFCAGLDLRDLGAGTLQLGNDVVAADGARPFPPLGKPLIGAINGPAVTGGFEIALCCDFLLASERARFADTHARVGVMPGWGLSVHLAAAIGVRRARELSYTGAFLDADTACAWGLVNRVVPHDQLLPTARAIATEMLSVTPTNLAAIKTVYDTTQATHLDEALAAEVALSRAHRFDREHLAAEREHIQARGRRLAAE